MNYMCLHGSVLVMALILDIRTSTIFSDKFMRKDFYDTGMYVCMYNVYKHGRDSITLMYYTSN